MMLIEVAKIFLWIMVSFINNNLCLVSSSVLGYQSLSVTTLVKGIKCWKGFQTHFPANFRFFLCIFVRMLFCLCLWWEELVMLFVVERLHAWFSKDVPRLWDLLFCFVDALLVFFFLCWPSFVSIVSFVFIWIV